MKKGLLLAPFQKLLTRRPKVTARHKVRRLGASLIILH
jgi:hypothetical protein